ncbi:MAG: phosphatase PAP2 family protein [Nocardioidaceae bacterium]
MGTAITTSESTPVPTLEPPVPPVDGPRPDEPDRRALALVWAVVAVFAAVAAFWSRHVGIPFRDPDGEIFVNKSAISLGIFAVLVLVDACVRAGRRDWSVQRATAVLRERWTGRRLALALSGLLAYHLVYFCYHNLKSWDVFNTVRDGFLLRVDSWLFLGHTPAVLLHDLLGRHVAAYLLLVVYESFPTLVSFAFVAAVVFTRRIRDGYVFLAAGLWIWILGVGSYYLIPSLGPFHAAPQVFAGLPHTMVTDTQARYMAQRAYLLQHPGAHDAFAQVSAFASLHVGVTTVILLMVRYYGMKRATRAMTVFLAGTIVATVYLGWHFAVDDVAGLLIGWLAVRLGQWMIYPRGRPAPEPGGCETVHVS